MCGIAGWISWEEDLRSKQKIVEGMTRKLTPRGPDAEGYWVAPEAVLGHRRLIVIDPEGGRQPMVRSIAGRQCVLIYNGELYNTAEIRDQLQIEGFRFQSYSDTEVVLLAYLAWGPDCLTRFNGIYAFAVWDCTTRSLFIARDRMGVKPLFYTQVGENLLFGSEIKAILAHPAVKPELDREGLAEIFGLGPARTPGNGVLKGICELRPGHYLIYSREGLHVHRYWQLSSGPHRDDFPATVERVRELVTDAIRRQLVSDVPVCTFLSGGLDSSIISAVAAQEYLLEGKSPLRTFSVDYHDNEKYFTVSDFQPNSDRPWALQLAEFLKTDHRWVILNSDQLVETLAPAMEARDLPGMADIDSSLWLFCSEIKKKATVALSGECADEVFGGYPWFHRPEAVAAATFPWSPSLKLRKAILRTGLRERLQLEQYVTDRYRETLAEVPHWSGDDPLESRRRELFYLNLNWFMAVLLDRKDRMSMASGLEVRVPFCDHRLVEYVWNIPWYMKSWNGREKGILREAFKGLLPEAIVNRKKSPYPKVHRPDYREAVCNRLRTIFQRESPLEGVLDTQTLTKLMANDRVTVPWYGQLMTGPQLFAYLIQVNDWMTKYQINIDI
ncbi:MAG TPA: asparagine synthase (glutamine-hydrolyzing) [Bacillota bacterium]|nr:asparagine synthase (glutamine-hydrolyzing) [Bacillota bacterium]